jgi:hypothetical protein
VVAIEHVLECIRGGGPCAASEEQSHACEIFVLGGVVERFVIVGIGAGVEEHFGEREIVVETAGAIEARERTVRGIVSEDYGISVCAVAE